MKQIIFKHSNFLPFKRRLTRKKITSFSQIELEKIDEETLVVTDINDTIITSSNDLWQKETLSSLTGKNAEKLSKLTPSQKNLLANLMMHKSSQQEMAESSQFFNELKKRKIPTLALTAAFSEPLDGIDMTDLIRKELKREGIQLCDLIKNNIIFTHLKKDQASEAYPTLIKEGILFTNGITNSKGDLLKSYLKLLSKDLMPKKIIFFDDSPKNLDSVEEAMKSLRIPVITYQVISNPSGLKSPLVREQKIWESLIDRSVLQAPRPTKIKEFLSRNFF